jgi:hypothetical protein
VVSTVPTTLTGSLNPVLSVEGFGPGPRSGVDFDDFRSGFAVWSGTSFAAPWVVGDIAAEVVAGKKAPTVTGSPSRALAASTQVVARAQAVRFGPEED